MPFFYCQHLLRQGREAVIIGQELDVVLSEFSEESASLAGHMVMPANVIIERSCIDSTFRSSGIARKLSRIPSLKTLLSSSCV